MKEQKTPSKILSIEEENELLVQASEVLEKIGNMPGVTSFEFNSSLDILGIKNEERRKQLLNAAISVESMMELSDLMGYITIH